MIQRRLRLSARCLEEAGSPRGIARSELGFRRTVSAVVPNCDAHTTWVRTGSSREAAAPRGPPRCAARHPRAIV